MAAAVAAARSANGFSALRANARAHPFVTWKMLNACHMLSLPLSFSPPPPPFSLQAPVEGGQVRPRWLPSVRRAYAGYHSRSPRMQVCHDCKDLIVWNVSPAAPPHSVACKAFAAVGSCAMGCACEPAAAAVVLHSAHAHKHAQGWCEMRSQTTRVMTSLPQPNLQQILQASPGGLPSSLSTRQGAQVDAKGFFTRQSVFVSDSVLPLRLHRSVMLQVAASTEKVCASV